MNEICLFPLKFLTRAAKLGFFPPRAWRKAPVAQLDRASDYESEGQGFESLRVYHSLSPATQKVAGFFVFVARGSNRLTGLARGTCRWFRQVRRPPPDRRGGNSSGRIRRTL